MVFIRHHKKDILQVHMTSKDTNNNNERALTSKYGVSYMTQKVRVKNHKTCTFIGLYLILIYNLNHLDDHPYIYPASPFILIYCHMLLQIQIFHIILQSCYLGHHWHRHTISPFHFLSSAFSNLLCMGPNLHEQFSLILHVKPTSSRWFLMSSF